MSGTAVISTVNHHRLRRAGAWLESRLQAEEVLIVGPTLDAANELSRKLAIEKGSGFGWHRLSLPQLASVVAAPLLASRQLVPLTRLGTIAIAKRVTDQLKTDETLDRYRAVAATPGFARAIANVIAELRLTRLLPQAVSVVDSELSAIISKYEAELAEAGLIDWPGVLASATEAVNYPNPHPLIGSSVLLLDAPISNESEFAFVHAVVAAAPEVLATIPSADAVTLRFVRDRLGLQIEDLDEADPAASTVSGGLGRLQHHLFKEHATSTAGEADHEIEVFSAPGEGRECVEIARRILRLAKDSVPFDRVAILLRSPEQYRAHLVEALARAGIPAHFTRGAVRPDPAGRAFYALLKCAAEGLSARRFAEYLSLGQVPDATPDGAPPDPLARADSWVAPDSEALPLSITKDGGELAGDGAKSSLRDSANAPVKEGQLRAPRRWERLLVEAAVIGGSNRWKCRIDGLRNELHHRLTELDKDDGTQAVAVARTLEDLAALAAYALPLIDELASLPVTAHWGEWLDRLSALATRTIKRPERVLAILSELSPMAPIGPVDLIQVLSILEILVLDTTIPPPSARYGRVFVGSIEAARGLSFDTVFVPGLAEKVFPRKIIEEPILLDALRQQLSEDLATNQSRLERERLALALAVGAAERRMCFSYPRIDLDQVRPRVPSFYALEVIRAAEGHLPDFAALAQRADTAATARLGWPAPATLDQAIDDAEHDLAILSSVMDSFEDSVGRARYLLSANPYLARALRTRYQRWGRAWRASDGMLSQSEAVNVIMAKHALSVRSYSPTALQHYARCPYRFFLQAIHGLSPRQVPERIDEMDPLQRGLLIHDIQFELLAGLRREKLFPVRTHNLDRVLQHLESVVQVVADRHKDELVPAIERVWENGVTAIRSDLREWLRRASEDQDNEFVPLHFELSFGLEHRHERRQADPRSVAGAIELDCGIQLRGSIDLIEGHPSGWICATDHKSGKADFKPGQLIAGGTSLQPTLYALAAEKLFAGEAKVTAGRLYFCTSVGRYVDHVVPLDDRMRDAAREVADIIGNAIAKPFLPAAPAKRQCERCDYLAVCGPYEERRAARKPKEDIEALLRLRERP
jgi:ATP-dependent helicase/nuclease subunit B